MKHIQRPCPFCGRTKISYAYADFNFSTPGVVVCENCNARGPRVAIQDESPTKALELWNERKKLTKTRS
jgi:Lar family restriction alleviation protein